MKCHETVRLLISGLLLLTALHSAEAGTYKPWDEMTEDSWIDFFDDNDDGTADYYGFVEDDLWGALLEDEEDPWDFLNFENGDPLRDSYRMNDIWEEHTGATGDANISDAEYLLRGQFVDPAIVGQETAAQMSNLFQEGWGVDWDVVDEMTQKNPDLLNTDGSVNARAMANLQMNPEFTNSDGALNFNRLSQLLQPFFSGLLNSNGTPNVGRIMDTLRNQTVPPGLARLATTGGGGLGGGGGGGGGSGVVVPSITPRQPQGVPSDLWGIIRNLFNFAINVSGVIFTVLLLIGGLMYLGSAGDEGAVTKAKNLMLAAIIGLVIVLSAWTVSNFVLTKLQAPASLSSTHQLSQPNRA